MRRMLVGSAGLRRVTLGAKEGRLWAMLNGAAPATMTVTRNPVLDSSCTA